MLARRAVRNVRADDATLHPDITGALAESAAVQNVELHVTEALGALPASPTPADLDAYVAKLEKETATLSSGVGDVLSALQKLQSSVPSSLDKRPDLQDWLDHESPRLLEDAEEAPAALRSLLEAGVTRLQQAENVARDLFDRWSTTRAKLATVRDRIDGGLEGGSRATPLRRRLRTRGLACARRTSHDSC